MFNPDEQALISFVQTHSIKLNLSERVKVYKGLADLVDAKDLIASLASKVAALERAENTCAELDLNFGGEGETKQ